MLVFPRSQESNAEKRCSGKIKRLGSKRLRYLSGGLLTIGFVYPSQVDEFQTRR